MSGKTGGNRFRVAGVELTRVRVPLKRPFVTALGSKTATENVRVRLVLAGGESGWGEASSSVVQAHLKPDKLEAALAGLAPVVLDRDVRRWRTLGAEARRSCGKAAAAAAALECALLDAFSRAAGFELAAFFGGARRSVDTDLTLSAWPAPQAAAAAREASRSGFKTLKIKVGTGYVRDLARVRSAARAGGRPAIILDGNQGMTRKDALKLVEACLADGLNVELLEQPLPREDAAGLRALTRACPVPVAADESARSAAETHRVLASGQANAVNVKVAKTGLAESLEIVAIARSAGAGLMIGCMQETSLGLSPSVHLACGTGAFRWVDLDSDVLLAEEKPEGRYHRRGATVTVSAS